MDTRDVQQRKFRGLIFARFGSNGERDMAVRLLRGANCMEGNQDIWAKPDKPLDIRVLQSLVFGTKHALSKYYDKSQIWGDIDEPDKSGGLWLGNDKIFTASIAGNQLSITFEDGWEEWLTHGDYPEFQTIIDTVKSKLASAKGTGKSKGKTKDGKKAGGENHP